METLRLIYYPRLVHKTKLWLHYLLHRREYYQCWKGLTWFIVKYLLNLNQKLHKKSKSLLLKTAWSDNIWGNLIRKRSPRCQNPWNVSFLSWHTTSRMNLRNFNMVFKNRPETTLVNTSAHPYFGTIARLILALYYIVRVVATGKSSSCRNRFVGCDCRLRLEMSQVRGSLTLTRSSHLSAQYCGQESISVVWLICVQIKGYLGYHLKQCLSHWRLYLMSTVVRN